jgi:hypothetical protein
MKVLTPAEVQKMNLGYNRREVNRVYRKDMYVKEKAMALHEFKPSLKGCPIEICLALSSEDHDPKVAAEHVYRCMNPVEWHSFRLLANALFYFTEAADAKTRKNVDAAARFTQQAQTFLKQVVIFWLKPRTCSCCVGLRQKLENEEEQKSVARMPTRHYPAGGLHPASNAVTAI